MYPYSHFLAWIYRQRNGAFPYTGFFLLHRDFMSVNVRIFLSIAQRKICLKKKNVCIFFTSILPFQNPVRKILEVTKPPLKYTGIYTTTDLFENLFFFSFSQNSLLPVIEISPLSCVLGFMRWQCCTMIQRATTQRSCPLVPSLQHDLNLTSEKMRMMPH